LSFYRVTIEGSAVQDEKPSTFRFIAEHSALDWSSKRHFHMPAAFIPCARCSTAEYVQFDGAVHFHVDNCSGQRAHSAVGLVGQGNKSVQHIGANGCSFQFRTQDEMRNGKRRIKQKRDSKKETERRRNV
jgi:hypothetical protein